MKKFFMMGAIALLLAGSVTFNACKKDKEDPKGVEMGKAFCDAAQKEDILALVSVLDKYQDYVTIDFETGDFAFKDKTVEADFGKYIGENCGSALENLGGDEE
jgi:hypothetical protein